ncbi:ralBP1-associated Eps domain-containing protein 1 isoform X2 [Scaptodrosophila lebanonensis]|uniref:RalBP1-associated Eps domain-containing protein 1 isoform X2 n=1 Tax=Drosophila lebanonensis TaxID=7225 RepID=A0A6J2U6N7_DROLE|nr:ralBP1-associated Eps domain-containing protein 1 isoform X2 [Scaptodrosophila lebanonensis]
MEEVTLTEPETRFYSELFLCCDVEKTGKVPMLKATELFRSADIANEAVIEITALAGIPSAALHISRAQFYSCLKLIAAHQAAMPLRQELIAATVQLPLPHFSWKEVPTTTTLTATTTACENGLSALPPPPPTDRRNSLQRRADAVRRNSQQQQQDQQHDTSDVPSTDSEVEQNESSCGGEFDEVVGVPGSGGGSALVSSTSSRETRRRGATSPEAWSTNSDSPTPTNSVAERPWAQEALWQGLLGDEHRQLLGTEEESSDRHSSDEDDNENELVTLYQITPEQREYYYKQFKAVQRDPHGLLSGQAARIFFEKSRIPVDELRHIWQLCDVTRDGALSLSEFTAAMHLVVLRRNNIPLPTSLPHCLHPNVLQAQGQLAHQHIPQEPPEADLLHLNDDDEDEHTDNTIIAANISGGSAKARPVVVPNDKNIMNLSSISTSSQASNSSRRDVTPPAVKNRSISSSPNGPDKTDKIITAAAATTTPTLPVTGKDKIWNSTAVASAGTATASNSSSTAAVGDASQSSSQWTKFSESPTTINNSGAVVAAATTTTTAAVGGAAAANAPAISSPGLKPVLFDMKRTAQDVGSNPQILHPVPLRVTPIGTALSNVADGSNSHATNDNNNESSVGAVRDTSPKPIVASTTTASASIANNQAALQSSNSIHRDSIQNSDLRAIQRPQAKKLPAKNIGALPPPPQRESSVGNNVVMTEAPMFEPMPTNVGYAKKEPPPLPPPRPHRHARSSSLDLNKFKMGATGTQQAELEGSTNVAEQQQHSLPPAAPPPHNSNAAATVAPPTRISLQTQQRVSAFEVYRKPNTPRNSQSPPPVPPTQPPPPAPFGALGATAISQLPSADNFEKRVTAISDSLRHVSFKQNQTTTTELLHRLREQNNSLLHLCNDLSDELLSVQTRKEEMRLKLEAAAAAIDSGGAASRTVSSISAPVTANVTGGSSGSGGPGPSYTNV